MLVQIFEENRRGTDWVVGDIHGCFTKLETELYTLGFDESKDRLFSVGDLVDRGPESEKCLEWLDKPWFHAVRGNHEQLLIDGYKLDGNDAALHYRNGGQWFFHIQDFMQPAYVDYLGSLPVLIEIKTSFGKVGIVHAEPYILNWDILKSEVMREDENTLQGCIWSRTKVRSKSVEIVKNIDKVYCGHTVLDKSIVPYTLGNTVYLDSGAVFGGRLTIVKID